jgi:hypothetical protein
MPTSSYTGSYDRDSPSGGNTRFRRAEEILESVNGREYERNADRPSHPHSGFENAFESDPSPEINRDPESGAVHTSADDDMGHKKDEETTPADRGLGNRTTVGEKNERSGRYERLSQRNVTLREGSKHQTRKRKQNRRNDTRFFGSEIGLTDTEIERAVSIVDDSDQQSFGSIHMDAVILAAIRYALNEERNIECRPESGVADEGYYDQGKGYPGSEDFKDVVGVHSFSDRYEDFRDVCKPSSEQTKTVYKHIWETH